RGGGGVSKEISEESPDTAPSEPEQSSQGNQKLQEASDENKSLAKTSEEGKGEKQAAILQPRTLKTNQSDYDLIPLGDDEDDVRDGLFSSENPVTTIQPRSS
ncbi:hypothetical protein, partial [Streptococcus pneumoniae]|uniref:hypothetical protein n=1 Tax=Streptococcus pneumoniae TaxID=1313 RepID=UPI000AC31D78